MNSTRSILAVLLTILPAIAHAGWMPILTSVPTLGETGLIGLAAAVGGLGAWLLSRKK